MAYVILGTDFWTMMGLTEVQRGTTPGYPRGGDRVQLGPGRRQVRWARSECRCVADGERSFDNMDLKPELLRGVYAYGCVF